MREFAATEWQRSKRAYESARKLVDDDPDSAVSRAYYAAFHALTAFFALQGKAFTKHSAIRSALHRDLIKPGKLNVVQGRNYDYLMDLRETGDYGGLELVTPKAARIALEKVNAFITAIEELYSQE